MIKYAGISVIQVRNAGKSKLTGVFRMVNNQEEPAYLNYIRDCTEKQGKNRLYCHVRK